MGFIVIFSHLDGISNVALFLSLIVRFDIGVLMELAWCTIHVGNVHMAWYMYGAGRTKGWVTSMNVVTLQVLIS